jgi:haloalkane dehalogenase
MAHEETVPEWVDRSGYHFTHRWMDVGAGRLHYLDEGTGPPLVLVPGNPDWSFSWRHLVHRFRQHYRCIVPDHLGFGLSDKPAHWSYLPRDHAHNLAALLEQCAVDQATLMVSDWGGPIALSWAVRNRQRVSALVVENSWCWDVRDDWYYRAYAGVVGGAPGRWLIRNFNLFAGPLLRAVVGNKAALTPAEHAHFKKQFGRPEERHGVATFPGQVTASGPWLQQIWDQLEPLARTPALFLWGQKDPAFREKELQRWLTRFTDAEVHRLPGVGHLPHLEAPGPVGDRLEAFLERISG